MGFVSNAAKWGMGKLRAGYVWAKDHANQILGTGAAAVAAEEMVQQAQAADVTLPDTGVDFESFTTAIGTNLGTTVLAVITVAAAFLCISIGWGYLKKFLGK